MYDVSNVVYKLVYWKVKLIPKIFQAHTNTSVCRLNGSFSNTAYKTETKYAKLKSTQKYLNKIKGDLTHLSYCSKIIPQNYSI